MNILIINAFGTSPKASQRFDSFCRLTKNIFKKISKGSGVENFNFICRSPNNISEFIYKHDMISGDVNQNKRNKKNFDKIDIVIIDGFEKYAPWDQKSYTLCEFIKLCKITDKTLYAGGVGFEILMYYLATGSLNEYNFVNAKGQIKSLEEMALAPKQFLKELKSNDIFLDFVTGDIFEYKNDETWVPIKNIGMHNQIASEKYFKRGKFVIKENFRGKDFDKNTNAFATTCDEIKVKITKHYFHHFLFQNLPLEFIAMTSMKWFPHFLNVLNQNLQYKILCECDKGPVVIEHKNSTGVLFHILDKYNDSVLFMENFIKKKFYEIQNRIYKFNQLNDEYIPKNEKHEIPAIFKYYVTSMNYKKNNQNIEYIKSSNLDKVTNSLAFSRIKNIKNEAHHVGFGINNRDMIFVENNYINQSPIFSTKKNTRIYLLKSSEGKKIINNSINKDLFSSDIIKNNNKLDKERMSGNSMTKLQYNNIENQKDFEYYQKKKKNLFLNYNTQNLNKIKLNKNIFFSSRNKNKAKYRLKSANNNNMTTNNDSNSKKKKFDFILNDKQKLQQFIDGLKKEKDNEKEEIVDIKLPKYPRPMILTGRSHEKKSISNSMNIGYLNKNENGDSNLNNVNFFDLGSLNKRRFKPILPK